MFPHRAERQRISRHPKPALGRFLRDTWIFHEERWNIGNEWLQVALTQAAHGSPSSGRRTLKPRDLSRATTSGPILSSTTRTATSPT
jgi:hypothetical protein